MKKPYKLTIFGFPAAYGSRLGGLSGRLGASRGTPGGVLEASWGSWRVMCGVYRSWEPIRKAILEPRPPQHDDQERPGTTRNDRERPGTTGNDQERPAGNGRTPRWGG